MDAAEASVGILNGSADIEANSDVEDDIVVRCKSKMIVLTSDDDEEDDGEIGIIEMKLKSKEVSYSEEIIDSEDRRVEIKGKDCNDIENDPGCSDSVKESVNLNSTVEMAIIENPIVGDEEKLEGINDDIGKSIDENETESGDLISLYSSRTVLPAEDETSEEKPSNLDSKRFTNILDSESEDEREVFTSLFKKKLSPRRDQSQDSRSTKAGPVRKPRRIVNSESEDEEGITDRGETSVPKKPEDMRTSLKSAKPNKISALIDTDSEEDNPPTHRSGGFSDEGEPMTKPDILKTKGKTEKQKRPVSIRAAKEEAMREIHSESQRMLRESQVCLPYHRPRQRTLQEFLNRRKALPILPATLTTAAKVKMSGKIVGKVLETKEKEAELFYKSSSDSDNEGGTQAEFPIVNIESQTTSVENNIENISMIEETQKIVRNDLKNSQGIKEAIQQGDKSLGVPRKLFNCSDNDGEATEAPSPIEENDSEKTRKENQDCNQKRKEFKQGLKDVSIPRKLFGSECVERTGIDQEQIDKIQEIRKTNDSQRRDSKKSNQSVDSDILEMLLENPKVRRNESMEEEAEDFELKMSEDPYEMTNDQTGLRYSKSSTKDFEAIRETPFINSRELSKSNEKEETDSVIITAEEDLASDDKIISSKDIHLSSTGDEPLFSSNTESSCNDEDPEDQIEPIGHVYGIPLPEFDDDKPKRTKPRILPAIMRLTPKLQGSPDMMIELSPPKVGVDQLIKRFLNHSVVKKTPELSTEITTIRTEHTPNGVKVINEVLPYRIPINEKNDDPELSKPGAKLVRLKEELQQQMAIQRTKEWKQKELEMKTFEDDDVYRDERSDCGIDEEDDVDEEGEELSDDGESEPDEDDVPMKEAKRKYKSPFVDAEADVSGEESEDKGEENEEDADSNNSFKSDNNDEEDEESETGASQGNKLWKLKRISKAFEDDDSNDAEVKETDVNASGADNDHHFRRRQTDADMFATDNNSDDDWLSGTEDDLPVYQRQNDEISQSCATPSVANKALSIVSPITQLTALNTGSESVNRDSGSAQNPLELAASLSVETTPIELKYHRECDSEKLEKLQKKLFDDIKDTPNDIELLGLCSGQFSDDPGEIRELDKLMHTGRKTHVSDAELLDLCSGTFDTQPSDIKDLEACGKKIPGVSVASTDSSLPAPDKSSKARSQNAETISSTYKIAFSSDDENDKHNSQVNKPRGKKLKKKVRKLELSDDEEESENGSSSELDERGNGEDEFVDYDSEENEIVVPEKDVRKVAAGFLDEEAELSESEWGSADEDEKDLDKLDWEEGDLEDIDQDQVKKQLEKIHMRQVLDEDQREVRLLQELLLEDGELHSGKASRQRKFKWKNIDELGEDDQNQLQSVHDEGDSADLNEAESELEWRKQKVERERFLEEYRAKIAAAGVEGEMEEDSQLFKLGMRALKKNKDSKNPNKDVSQAIVADQSQTSVTRHTVADLFASPGCGKKTLAMQKAIHRGSFLARGEEYLARLSTITRQNSDQSIIMTKKSRNFVFAHLSPAIEAPVESEGLDDQKNTQTMDAKLRKRKPPFSLTPVTSKRSKKEY